MFLLLFGYFFYEKLSHLFKATKNRSITTKKGSPQHFILKGIDSA